MQHSELVSQFTPYGTQSGGVLSVIQFFWTPQHAPFVQLIATALSSPALQQSMSELHMTNSGAQTGSGVEPQTPMPQ